MLEPLRDQGGYSLPELLTVMAILPVVLGATLTTFTGFNQTVRRNQDLAESQGRTREAIDHLSRDLRNLASPTPEQPQAVDWAGPYDFVFQTVDSSGPGAGSNPANVRRVRYCLDTSTTAPARLYSQVQSWTTALAPAVPSRTTCPGPTTVGGWGGTKTLVDRVTNRLAGADRPLFQFNSAVPTKISAVIVQAWVQDPGTKGKEPDEGLLRSQVFLRNQNEAPTARFDDAVTNLLHVLLNGSASFDPEGDQLIYRWYDGPTQVAEGIVVDLKVNNPGLHAITLKVFDPAGLEGSVTRQVNIVGLP